MPQASTFDARMYFVFRARGSAVGVLSAHIDDVSGCREKDVLVSTRLFLERRFGPSGTEEKNFAQVGIVLAQGKDFPVRKTQQRSADAVQFIPTTEESWPSGQRPLKMEDIRRRQSKLGKS